MARAAKTSTKIKRQSKTPAQRMAEAVTSKGEAIGAPAIQVARGFHAIVDAPLVQIVKVHVCEKMQVEEPAKASSNKIFFIS